MAGKKEKTTNPFDDIPDSSPPAGRLRATTDRRMVAMATNKKSLIAGQYVRRTFTYLPSQLEQITRIAQELNMSENDVARWFADHMIEAYQQGVRPQIKASSVKVQPELREW